ncbi:unnamed protein product [Zymoseptoria tritici ST99CH_1A5]|uniref:Uncharacterized protein n=3 Tax=Zymoseptoria tritici TaxID=1047171 RepID=A0A1X7S8K3_ZYMT9|nr:unnamed protein product [Zymoseptoria tritici ST99CH_3D7]SMR61853.1 unnamed protein product [Zymoseptoria tritici ST99CH_1E4]SMR64354.1 unnamed protein product [Zymoseptoria tritici ST99CH_3D1]SMY29699.1 unnamed protein product [Zymoseptoria tritici ST99CH_1A5]
MEFNPAKWAKRISHENIATLTSDEIKVISRDEKEEIEKAKMLHRISGYSDNILGLYICLCTLAAEWKVRYKAKLAKLRWLRKNPARYFDNLVMLYAEHHMVAKGGQIDFQAIADNDF